VINFRSDRVAVTVPATSANLGPGFDCFGLALDCRDEVSAQITPTGTSVTVTGEGAGTLPTDDTHLVVRAMVAGFDRIGRRPTGLQVSCHNRIPQARGLGSSSAAIIAGLLLARELTAGENSLTGDEAVLALAAELEGHPDNVAACLLGGATVAWTASGGARAVRLSPHPSLRPVVFVPADQALTVRARAALPVVVSHADAAANAGRAALLTHALSDRPDLLFAATEDWLHQRYRAEQMPATAALVATLRATGVAAVVSGAGPAVLALTAPPSGFHPGAGWRSWSGPVAAGAAVSTPSATLGP